MPRSSRMAEYCCTWLIFVCSISNDDLNLQIERLARTDSDFSPFLHHAGIPSVDLYYGKGILGPLIQ